MPCHGMLYFTVPSNAHPSFEVFYPTPSGLSRRRKWRVGAGEGHLTGDTWSHELSMEAPTSCILARQSLAVLNWPTLRHELLGARWHRLLRHLCRLRELHGGSPATSTRAGLCWRCYRLSLSHRVGVLNWSNLGQLGV